MPSRRSGRAAAKKAAAALEAGPCGLADAVDEPIPDTAAADVCSEPEKTPTRVQSRDQDRAQDRDQDQDQDQDQGQEDDEYEDEVDGDDDDEEEPRDGKGDTSGDDPGTGKDEESAKDPTPGPQKPVRRNRLGRPPKNRTPDWDPMVTVTDDTPRRRGRGGGRGRGGRKGGPVVPKAEQVVDTDGTVAEIIDDECVLAQDLEGEAKVDPLGNLAGGREYRCRTFTMLGRGNRLYMLSTEPARCVGFRDSYLFFTKHRKLYKIIVDDDEKRDMIERNIIPHSYKGRSIGIVTARSVFREFGARIIVGGRRIVDDYNVAQARADGAAEGDVADPDDRFVAGEPYNKNQYVAWHGASAVYHTNTPSAPVPSGKPEHKKRRVNVNDTNWMLEHAREASIFNSAINAVRRLNNLGVYDIHTNTMQYPAAMQPTLARIEQVAPGADGGARFPPVPARVSRNLLVTDTIFESPPVGAAPTALDRPGAGDPVGALHGIASVPREVRDLLPDECRRAFDAALRRDAEWKARWGPERDKTSRRDPVIDKAIVPYSMG